jgi:hypothetical protein
MSKVMDQAVRPDYVARLRGGPDDGALVRIPALSDGAPPDFFHAGPQDPGVYVLAGLPHADGSMPYWFMSSQPGVAGPVDPARSTWTLISLARDGLGVKAWHQHGEATRPVRLRAEPASSSRTPAAVGVAYVCPECDDLTVMSVPDA